MPLLLLYNIGEGGVDVDTEFFDLDKSTLRKSQNAVRDQAGLGFRNRPGLEPLNADEAAAGDVLGGIGVPFLNESESGVHILLIGRGLA